MTLHVSGLSLCSRDRQQVKPTLRDLQSKSGSSVTPSPIPAFCAEQPGPHLSAQASLGPALLDSPPAPEVTLKNVFVPLESIRPSKSQLTYPGSREVESPAHHGRRGFEGRVWSLEQRGGTLSSAVVSFSVV